MAEIDDEDDDDRLIRTAGIDDEDADDIERGYDHGDDGGGAFLIRGGGEGGTDLHACVMTLLLDAFFFYIIHVIFR
jgi:hypothetical protein